MFDDIILFVDHHISLPCKGHYGACVIVCDVFVVAMVIFVVSDNILIYVDHHMSLLCKYLSSVVVFDALVFQLN